MYTEINVSLSLLYIVILTTLPVLVSVHWTLPTPTLCGRGLYPLGEGGRVLVREITDLEEEKKLYALFRDCEKLCMVAEGSFI